MKRWKNMTSDERLDLLEKAIFVTLGVLVIGVLMMLVCSVLRMVGVG